MGRFRSESTVSLQACILINRVLLRRNKKRRTLQGDLTDANWQKTIWLKGVTWLSQMFFTEEQMRRVRLAKAMFLINMQEQEEKAFQDRGG